MRLDKYLKVSRLIKRRTVANEACDAGRVMINGKTAKAGTDVKVGDVIEIGFGTRNVKVEVLDVQETTRKSCSVICNCSEPSKISKTGIKCVAFWRLALNSYRYL